MTNPNRTPPTVSPETRPFWEGCKGHQLLVQRCSSCDSYQFYPRGVCSSCMSGDLEWIKASGKGKVFSYSVVHVNRTPQWAEQVPYVVAYVELDEGVRMFSNIVGCDPQEVRIGMPVEVTFDDLNDEVAVPLFRPAEA